MCFAIIIIDGEIINLDTYQGKKRYKMSVYLANETSDSNQQRGVLLFLNFFQQKQIFLIEIKRWDLSHKYRIISGMFNSISWLSLTNYGEIRYKRVVR